MKYLMIALRILANILLYVIYSVVFINIVNFLYGLVMTTILDKSVPAANDPIHMQIALFSLILVSVLTLVFRKRLYLSITNVGKKELEIFIDKEIK